MKRKSRYARTSRLLVFLLCALLLAGMLPSFGALGDAKNNTGSLTVKLKTDVKKLPKDAVILTAGCAKYRLNRLDLGDIGGIPRLIDAGQCNDCYSLVVIALKLAEVFGTDVNGLPLSFNISWYEQKAVLVLLTLLSLGVKDIMLGPRLPKFISPGILDVLVKNFGIKGNSTVREDMVILNIAEQ
jgi:hydroxylamine reductase